MIYVYDLHISFKKQYLLIMQIAIDAERCVTTPNIG